MPYIKQTQRELIDEEIITLVGELNALGIPEDQLKGVLNYTITRILLGVYSGYEGKSFNYSRINDVIGILDCVKLEFYRRFAAEYENSKILENGDVY